MPQEQKFVAWLRERKARGERLTPQEDAVIAGGPIDTQTTDISTPFRGLSQPGRSAAGTAADIGQAAGFFGLSALGPLSMVGGTVLPEALRKPVIEKLPPKAQLPAEIAIGFVGGGGVPGAVGGAKALGRAVADPRSVAGKVARAPALAMMGVVTVQTRRNGRLISTKAAESLEGAQAFVKRQESLGVPGLTYTIKETADAKTPWNAPLGGVPGQLKGKLASPLKASPAQPAAPIVPPVAPVARTAIGAVDDAARALPAGLSAKTPLIAAADAPPAVPPVRPPVSRSNAPLEDPLTVLTRYIKEAKPANRETAALVHARRQQQAAQLGKAFDTAKTREDVFGARRALQGELPVADFEPPKNRLAKEQWDDLYRRISSNGKLQPFDKNNAGFALEKVENGQVPTDSELELLENVFGKDFIRTLHTKGLTGVGKVMEKVTDVMNVPRSLQSSFDISATLRQGSWFSTSRPKEFAGAFKSQIRALASEDAAKSMNETLRLGPKAQTYKDAKLYIAPLDGILDRREEAFISTMAERIPGVRASGRAYVTFLNKLRADVFDGITEAWKREGKNATQVDLEELAKYVNRATGRGSFGKIDPLAKDLTNIFYSPRFVASRFQTAQSLFSKSAPVRKEAWRDFGLYAGPRVAALAALGASGAATVEWDPRSSDFAKVRMGSVRIDPWGGFQPVVRYIAQAASGQSKSIGTGDVSKVRGDWYSSLTTTLGKFARSKLAPVPSAAIDIISGRQVTGEDTKLMQEAIELATPLVFQEAYDVAQQFGLPAGAAAGGVAATGLGVQAYWTAPKAWQTEMKPYFDIPSNGIEAKRLKKVTRDDYRKGHPEVDAKLFLAGQTSSLVTDAAKRRAVALMKEQRMKVEDIQSLDEKPDEPQSRKQLRAYFQRALGEQGGARQAAPSAPSQPARPWPKP